MMRMRAGLWVVAVLGLVVLVAFSQPEKQKEVVIDLDSYHELLASRVCDIGDLQDWFFEQLDAWLPLLPPAPDVALRQDYPGVLVFDWKDFPPEFVEGLSWRNVNGVPVASISIFVDPATSETVFLSGDAEIYALEPTDFDRYAFLKTSRPQLYSGRYSESAIAWYESLYDPTRLTIDVTLLPSDPSYLELYLYAEAQIEEARLALAEGEDGGLMLLREGDPTELAIEKIALASGGIDLLIGYPAEYIDSVWSIFSYDAPACALEEGGEALLSMPPLPPDGEEPPPPDGGYSPCVTDFTKRFQGLDTVWELIESTLVLTGETHTTWHDSRPLGEDAFGNPIHRFYALGSTLDEDGDGLSSAYELFCSKTDNLNWDTDGDGISDGEEVLIDGTDPLDKYSVRPPDMLRTEGAQIVDESGNPIILKSVNIGGWLAFEQWMLGFQPKIVTNMIGEVSDDHMPEATLRELLVDRVDFAVTRLATNHNGASGVSINGGSMSHVGSFGNGKWIRYDADFGTGVSNFSVVIARGIAGGNPRINVHVGAVDGPSAGVLCVADTDDGPPPWGTNWTVWSEQSVRLTNAIAGVTSVYLVAESSANDIGNVHRVRFYRDDNTRALFDTFRDNYFTTNDLDRLKALGYNTVRVPFLADMIMNGTNFMEEGWTHLDWVVDECAKRRMWVILDLHGTPGGQSPFDHSGQPKGLWNLLWTSAEYKNRLAQLWNTVAARYATNSAVAGFDLFNEPEPGGGVKTLAYSNAILPVLEQAYQAVRSTNTRHIVFMMSNFMYTNMWNDIWACPAPADRGWSNVVYQFHHHDHIKVWDNDVYNPQFDVQKVIADQIVRTYTRFSKARNVPVFIGEFMPVDMQNFDYFIRRFEASNLHWAHWNYRHWGHDDEYRPWSSWGLDYRIGGIYKGTNTSIQPNVMTDEFGPLMEKFAGYNPANYAPHPHLPKVVSNHARDPQKARTRTEFYLNTFNGPDVLSLVDHRAWPWRKLAALGNHDNAFTIDAMKARVLFDWGGVIVRFKSREEADARFEVNNATGCWFSFEPWNMAVTNEGAGAEAEMRLCVVRDEITSRAYTYDTAGLIARMQYEKSGAVSNVILSVHAKTGGTDTFGMLLYQSDAMSFVPGMPLKLFVNAMSASLVYGVTTNWTGSHGLDLGTWPDGAVGVVEAEDPTGSRTWYVEMDNFKAWRPDAEKGRSFLEDFSAYPDGIAALAEPEFATLRRWSTATEQNGYVTNNALRWIPQTISSGGSWYNPRHDYHNDVRLNLTATNVVEIQVAYSAFSNGIAKIAFMPEFFNGEIYDQHVGDAVYLQLKIRPPGHVAEGNLAFDVYTHHGPEGNRTWHGYNEQFPYVDGQTVTIQMAEDICRIWYGASVIVNQQHGNATNWTHSVTNAADRYAKGVYPHLEFQNESGTTSAALLLDAVLTRQLPDFTSP